VLDRDEFERWRKAAAGAQRSAELQATSEQHNWACFLAEQSAQLALKAILHGLGIGAWGHDLVTLGDRLQAAAEDLPTEPIGAALRRLSRHYIPARYPDAHPSGPPESYYGREDVQSALADLQLILANVDRLWAALSSQDDASEHGEAPDPETP
jgi:HEPN domain-containing protein